MNSEGHSTRRDKSRGDRFSLSVAVVLCTLLVGCGQSPYELAEVQGLVTIDGVPFTEGKVMFSPAAKEGETKAGRAAFGRLDGEGRFTLTTYNDGDGAIVGQHRVTLFNTSEDPRRLFNRVTLPQGFVTVASGEVNEIEVAFTADEIKKYGNRL